MATRDPWERLWRPVKPFTVFISGQGSPSAPQMPAKILKQMSFLMLAESQKAFGDQKFGGVPWKERYPNQPSGAKLNIAGALEDLADGPSVKNRRYDARPALIDRGILRRSLAPRVAHIRMRGAYSVEVGTTLQYAGVHQWGGFQKIPVTATMRSNYLALEAKLARRASGKAKTAPQASRELGILRKYLPAILRLTTYVVKVVKRPFLGVTADLGLKFKRLIGRNLSSPGMGGP